MMHGTLLRSADLTAIPDASNEAQFFIVREGKTSGFLIEASTFAGGECIARGVRFLAGTVLVVVTVTSTT